MTSQVMTSQLQPLQISQKFQGILLKKLVLSTKPSLLFFFFGFFHIIFEQNRQLTVFFKNLPKITVLEKIWTDLKCNKIVKFKNFDFVATTVNDLLFCFLKLQSLNVKF
eukprot:TRINITY_DN14920_c0_g1_i1.p8 TRINITY_DN14920_c0_g1~~TRINITY_DN14920_c0_g1_i1.p8  ORF type:complete len:109 (+),score=12.26 TRINITY_DN14920_c0_g1_i1:752-1078(+)